MISAERASRPQLHVAMEAVFGQDSLGRYYSPDVYTMAVWQAPLRHFRKIKLVVRVEQSAVPCSDQQLLDPSLVEVVALPKYKGAVQFLKKMPSLLKLLWQESASVEIALLRLPGVIGGIFGILLKLRRTPYAIQMVGDIDEVFKTINFGRVVGLLRRPLVSLTRRVGRGASVGGFVTQRSLQSKYGLKPSVPQFVFSDIELRQETFADKPKEINDRQAPVLLFCGSLAQLYKGLDVLIEAVAQLPSQFANAKVKVLGDGIYRAQLENLAAERQVASRFEFLGAVPRPQVLEEMGSADLFLMPSRTEGLPRAMIEAMAKALPCIGSSVGGIPELLEDVALVPPDNAEALAAKIGEFLNNPQLMQEQSARNLHEARRYEKSILNERRNAFFAAIAAAARESKKAP